MPAHTRSDTSDRRTTSGSTQISLLGGFGLSIGGTETAVPARAEKALALLGLSRGALHRSHVAGTLWLEATEERASANLRSLLWRLRKVAPGVIQSRNAHLELSPETEVDTWQMEALATRIIGENEIVGSDWTSLSAELLPDWGEDWVQFERERLRQLQLHALDTLTRKLTEVGRYAAATETAMRAIRRDPLRESSHRALIEIHLAEGNRSEARRHFERFVQVLESELGLEPSPLIRAQVGA